MTQIPNQPTDKARSIELLEEALAIFRGNNFLKHYTVHLYSWLAEASMRFSVSSSQGWYERMQK